MHFGAGLVFASCEAQQVQVVILNAGEDTTFEEGLAQAVLEVIVVFSARVYRSRSRIVGWRAPRGPGGVVMIRSHKMALDPSDVQETYFRKAVGTVCFADNGPLAECQRQYEAREQDNSLLTPSTAAFAVTTQSRAR